MQRQPCPRVKRAVWHSDGTLLEVEYWPSGQWESADIIYPRTVFSEVSEVSESSEDPGGRGGDGG